jgi:hypothetical protein
MDETQAFPYKPKSGVMALVALFFGVCAYVIYLKAAANDRGLILNHILEFTRGQASGFYYALAGLSAAMALVGCYGFYKGLTSKSRLVITADTITLPGTGLRDKQKTLEFAQITGAELQRIQKQVFLLLHHSGGKMTITKQMFSSAAEFDKCVQTVEDRLEHPDTAAFNAVQNR